eukprot:TRINITY_DN5744_c0_g1_i15.p1 TRINITY_DN5744_c0_g1~~TRINITY_DN5744_c0_g1_i15.p1  ORF type:complete len:242 (+),score=42.59 TRINITY_DN5744_c0_g1_i15:1570-2295(+)
MYTIYTTDRESLEKELKMLRVSEDGNRRRDGSSTANYRQLHQSLLHLQESADRIFDTISDRTAKEQEKLMDLSMRIRNAKGKVDAISGSKKSVTVWSCARYPSNVNVEDFHSLFGYDDGATGVGFPVAKLSLNGGLNREFGDDGTLDLYKFFSETTCEFLPMEVCLEKGDLSKRAAFAKNIAETPKFSNSSFLMEDHIAMDSLQDPKNQALPPPPPSLLLHNMMHRYSGPNMREATIPNSG